MKKSFTLLTMGVLMSGICFGQITANEMPNIGDTITYKGINKNTFDVMAAVTGVNLTWNHSQVVETAEITNYYFVDPATTAGAAEFPTSTVAEATDGSVGNFYYSLTATGFYRDGIWDPASIMIPYANTLKLYEIPFQFGTTFTDNYHGVGDMVGGIDSVYIASPNGGAFTSDVDGFGTLYLPTGRFDSVYRVYYTEDFTVKFDLLTPGMTVFTIAEYGYEYWKRGFVKPLLVYINTSYSDMGGTNQVTTSVRYNKTATPDGPVPGFDELTSPVMNMYPNPTTGPATIEFTGRGNLIQIFDATGKLILSAETEDDRFTCDLGAYGKGIYMVHIISNSGKTSARKLLVK
jgi:hypothetical protein